MYYLFTYGDPEPFYLGLRSAPSWETLQYKIRDARKFCPKNYLLQNRLEKLTGSIVIERLAAYKDRDAALAARRAWLDDAVKRGVSVCNPQVDIVGPCKKHLRPRRKSRVIPGADKWYTYVYENLDTGKPIWVTVGKGLRLIRGKGKKAKGRRPTKELLAFWDKDVYTEIETRDPVDTKQEAERNAQRLRDELVAQGIKLTLP